MKLAILVASIFLALAPGAPTVAATPSLQPRPYTVTRNVQFDMASKICGRTYRIFVHTPATPPPPGGYPVLYLTDGNTTFPITAGQAELDALVGGRMMVVGIGYPTEDAATILALRWRDLTPSPPANFKDEVFADAPGFSSKREDFGGEERFYRFITEELRPALDAAYRFDPKDQTLYGHSLGGLFTLGVLFRHPDAFRGFVASSPSIWYNDREVLKGEAGFRRRVETGGVAPRILIEVGGEEQSVPAKLPPSASAATVKASLEKARMVGNAVDLAARLSALKGRPGYEVLSQVFEHEDHISTMAASMSRALTFSENR